MIAKDREIEKRVRAGLQYYDRPDHESYRHPSASLLRIIDELDRAIKARCDMCRDVAFDGMCDDKGDESKCPLKEVAE